VPPPKPVGDLDSVLADIKTLWNRLRQKQNTKAQTREIMDELMVAITGRVRQIALKHDAARVVQAAVQFGSVADRRAIVSELAAGGGGDAKAIGKDRGKKSAGVGGSGGMAELCTVQYAHFVVLKILKYCCGPAPTGKDAGKDVPGRPCGDETVRRSIVRHCLRGNVLRLSTHANGSGVVELALETLPKADAEGLRRELFGREFTPLFSDGGAFGTADGAAAVVSSSRNMFADILDGCADDPKKTEKLLSHVTALLNKFVDRGLLALHFVQRLLFEYFDGLEQAGADATGKLRSEIASAIADRVPHAISSRAGAAAACAAFGFASAKDRKKMMKSLKGYVGSTLEHRDAYIVPARMATACDDTVSSSKYLIDELVKGPPPAQGAAAPKDHPLLAVSTHPTAHRMLLAIMSRPDTLGRLFGPYERTLLAPTFLPGADGADPVPTSKKDPEVRRAELLKGMKTATIALCGRHARRLMEDRAGAAVLREACGAFPEETARDVAAATAVGDGDVFEHPTGHLLWKQVLSAEADDGGDKDEDGGAPAAAALHDMYGGKLLQTVGASNRGAFVLCELSKAGGGVGEKVWAELGKGKGLKELQARAKKGTNTKGYEALLALMKKKR